MKVGDGVTLNFYTDRKVGTVTKVSSSGKTVLVQLDNMELLNGSGSGEPDALTFTPGGFVGHTSGTQRWECTPDPDGAVYKFTLRKNGRYVRSGDSTRTGVNLSEGRHPYYDFNF